MDLWKENYIMQKVKGNMILFEKIKYIHKKNNKPLSKIFQEKYFWKNVFKTNKHTLDPRNNTEYILEILHKRYINNQNLKILELGVGTGAIIISTLLDFTLWNGIGIDISHQALKIARYNCNTYKLNDRLRLTHNDWLNNIDEEFDILITNPPYMHINEYNNTLDYEPKLALYEPSDLYFYKEIYNKIHLFKHIIMELNCCRNINDYINIFSKYKYEIYYGYDNIPIILEIFVH